MPCERRGKWFGGCKFEPRYDLGAADLTPFESIKATSSALFETMRTKTYRGDVCVRCGAIINHPLDIPGKIDANQAGS